jgi:hypothetical protein
MVKQDKSKSESKQTDGSGESNLNKDTLAVGLEFNVKPFRKWMKEHYERQSKKVGVVNAHYIMAAVDQVMTFSLLHGMSESFKKNDKGIYDVSLDDMMNHVKLTQHLADTFHYALAKYDDTLDYVKQLSVDKKSFTNYINKYVFNDNFRMNLSKSSTNFLSYLLVQTNTMLANTSLVMTEFAKKSRVTNVAITSALKVHFSGKLYDDIMKKVDSVETLLKNKEKQDSEKDSEKKSEKDDKKGNSKDKKSKGKDSDNEDDDGDDNDGSDDEKEKSDDESEDSDADSDGGSDGGSDGESDEEDKSKVKKSAKKSAGKSEKPAEKPVKKQNKKK